MNTCPLQIAAYGRRLQRILRELLRQHGLMAHLKANAELKKGTLVINIDTDPRAVRFLNSIGLL